MQCSGRFGTFTTQLSPHKQYIVLFFNSFGLYIHDIIPHTSFCSLLFNFIRFLKIVCITDTGCNKSSHTDGDNENVNHQTDAASRCRAGRGRAVRGCGGACATSLAVRPQLQVSPPTPSPPSPQTLWPERPPGQLTSRVPSIQCPWAPGAWEVSAPVISVMKGPQDLGTIVPQLALAESWAAGV